MIFRHYNSLYGRDVGFINKAGQNPNSRDIGVGNRLTTSIDT